MHHKIFAAVSSDSSSPLSSQDPQALPGTIQLDIPSGALPVGETAEWNLTLTGADHMKSCGIDLTAGGTGAGTLTLHEGNLGGTILLNDQTDRISWQNSASVTDGTICHNPVHRK